MSVDDMGASTRKSAKTCHQTEIECSSSRRSSRRRAEPARRKMIQHADIRTKMIEDRAKWFRERARLEVQQRGCSAGAVPRLRECGPVNRDDEGAGDRLSIQRSEKKAKEVAECMQEIEKVTSSSSPTCVKEKEARTLSRAEFQVENLGRVTVMQEGNLPNDPVDNRTKSRLVGFVGGRSGCC
jgi:hypothetical protein